MLEVVVVEGVAESMRRRLRPVRNAYVYLPARARRGFEDQLMTLNPASAAVWSCSPVPPLTPTAPTTHPLRVSGIPPAKIMILP